MARSWRGSTASPPWSASPGPRRRSPPGTASPSTAQPGPSPSRRNDHAHHATGSSDQSVGGSADARRGEPRWANPGQTRLAAAGRPHGEDCTMSEEQVAPETRGVAVELLATVDLGPEIQGIE